jgi:hypothetical protein
VWRLDWQRVHRHFGFPPRALLIEDFVNLFGDGQFTPWSCFAHKEPDRSFAAMIEPSSLDERIVVQRGTFTLTSDTCRSFDAFLEAQGLADTLTKFVFPAERTTYLRDQLDIAGIDERRLFPDLDGVAAELRRYYS